MKLKYKERWTAEDERMCESCWKHHWKKIDLYDKFEKDVIGASLHPNCRCDIIPIINPNK